MHLLVVAVVLVVLAPPLAAQDSLVIHHIDVNQGDATVVVAPNGRTLLIDSGLDHEADAVTEVLEEHGVDRLDGFLATHYDRDHYGGIDKVVEADIDVDQWYDRGEKEHVPPDKKDDDDYKEYVRVAEPLKSLMPGDTILLDPAVTITVVASNCHVRGAVGKYEINSLDENGYSVTLLINYEGFNYLIGGDLTREVEQRIAGEAAVGDVDVYHVNHHGSHTSSSHAFMQAIRPEVAVISNGSHGGFNHPRQAVLDTLQTVEGIQIYQTNRLEEQDLDNSGQIVGGNVSEEFIADLEPGGSEGTVTIVVKGGSYRISIPERGLTNGHKIE